MAIIKFISDKDCQLFIDKEFVGSIHANQMLKYSLEAGSYLIEVNNLKGKRIKKYELTIKATDTQLLQDLDQDYSFEDIIDELKNDSSLHFYNQRAIFSYNSIYGFINSKYKIVITPQFSYAENFLTDKTLVKRVFQNSEKATVIDLDGNICLGQWYDYIGADNKTVLLKDENTFYVLSSVTYSIINEFPDAGSDGKANLIPVFQEIDVDQMYGYIDKIGNIVIPLIYDYAWNFEDNGFAKVKRFGYVSVIDMSGTLFRTDDIEIALKDGKPYFCSIIERESLFGTVFREEIQISPEESNKTNVIVKYYDIPKITKEESLSKGFEFIGLYSENNYYPVKINGKWMLGYDDVFNPEQSHILEDYCCDKILNAFDEYFIYRTDGLCKLVSFQNPNIAYSFLADEITPVFVYYSNDIYDKKIISVIIKKNKKYGLVNLSGLSLVPIEYDLIITTDSMRGSQIGEIGIITKDGKCSFLSMSDGSILEPFKYEDITIINNEPSDSFCSIDSVYFIKENGKFGLLDINRNSILPSDNDSIDFTCSRNRDFNYCYRIIFVKNGKVGAYEISHILLDDNRYHIYRFFVKPEYDECVFQENKNSVNSICNMAYVAVRKNDKWGIIDNSPRKRTYYYNYYIDEWENYPNLNDLTFKYNSLNELTQDADFEFQNRFHTFRRGIRPEDIKDNPAEPIDLGLPSGTLWASYNVGATRPEEYGKYYAWGENVEKEEYSWKNYRHCYNIRYYKDEYVADCDYIGSCISNTDYDVAHVRWGDGWQMPTINDMMELCGYCRCKKTIQNGVKGFVFIGSNGNTIFLPASGGKEDSDCYCGNLGEYWSGTCPIDENCAYFLYLDGIDTNWNSLNEYCCGKTVRPVMKQNVAQIKQNVCLSNNSLVENKSEIPAEAVDLGLPSGTKWASCNFGATKSVESGGYYAWGENQGKKQFTKENYIFSEIDKDGIYKIKDIGFCISGSKYDIVHSKWGDNWQIPTIEQVKELLEYCYCESITFNGIKGHKFTGPNKNSIFMPAAGKCVGDKILFQEIGYYWSGTKVSEESSSTSESKACAFSNSEILPECGDFLGCYNPASIDYFNNCSDGLCIRPVMRK